MSNLDNVVRKYKDKSSRNNISRYRNMWRVLDDQGDFYQESYDTIEIPKSSSDRLHEVGAGEENRLDLISYKYYNTPLLWWVIAEASGIVNPFDVPVGTRLRIPSNQTLYGNKGVLL